MIRILGTIFAGLFGLAFGSFLNVCLSRWPEGESIVHPHSHCRNCDHSLSWWENIPLVSWIALRGRCRNCYDLIGWRYPLVELVVGALWAMQAWRLTTSISYELLGTGQEPHFNFPYLLAPIGMMIFSWLLVALAVLDAENLWLPNFLTLPGAVLGLAISAGIEQFGYHFDTGHRTLHVLIYRLVGIVLSAGLILLIRWLYKLIRHREGIGLGDAKLMAMLAAWLGLPGALLAFGLGVILGAIAALILLFVPSARRESSAWAASKLPLGTFLCIGGIVSSLWGQPIINAYLRWVGL